MKTVWNRAAGAGVVVGLMLGACKPSGVPATAAAPSVMVYEMRGVIVKLPTEKAPQTWTISHEATRDMDAMTMGFYMDPPPAAGAFGAGDKVAFRYEVDAKTYEDKVTRMEKLPGETVLKLEDTRGSAATTTKPAG